jgi:uncharacterized protein (TIGR04255 family)
MIASELRPVSEHETPAKVSYGSPPVTETSLGIQFSPLLGWDVNLFGLLHERIRKAYPKFESAAPVLLAPQPMVFLLNVPKIRGIYSSASMTDVVQLQDDFFFVNWRKMPSSAVYPRYAAVRARFVEQWAAFLGFLNENALATPLIHRYQVTYVNHTEEGAIRPGDLLSNWVPPGGADPFGLALSATYRLGEKNADVTIVMQPAVRSADGVRVTQTTITTARSVSTPTVDLDPVRQVDDMHDALIETFQAITTDGAKAHWGPQ